MVDLMKRNRAANRSRSGMAMLVVLFIVMAIAIISSGFIARSDTALAAGRNFCIRNEADYAAWGGMEIARALVRDPNTLSATAFPVTGQLDNASAIYYDLMIGSPVAAADPNVFVYSIECSGYQQVNGERRTRSTLYGKLRYDSDAETAGYLSIRREE
jgi:hypothetical protein